jgi:hypothetical protein
MEKDNHNYDDIIHLPHPTSLNHPRMSMYDRAAQFSAFAALTGYDEAIKETARLTDQKEELDEDVITGLNEKLQILKAHLSEEPKIDVTYFVPDDRKSGGSYETYSGVIKKINEYERTLMTADHTIIPIAYIREINSALFREI